MLSELFEHVNLKNRGLYRDLTDKLFLCLYGITFYLKVTLNRFTDKRLAYLHDGNSIDIARVGAMDAFLEQMVNERNSMPIYAVERCLGDLAGTSKVGIEHMSELEDLQFRCVFVNFVGYFVETYSNVRKLFMRFNRALYVQ
ncbi:hypothetical protein [Borrelia hispanica]|nr:hypothetical protein [Borrelia hispanica]